ncbi:MAG TPA: hypothetical protein PKL97_07740, partial [Candidatus Omnitrophota bacterium]|nr:hypothetical protein [Candidatus Omnitrophota bacterium]
EWIFRCQKEFLLSLQIAQGMFKTLDASFFNVPEVEGIVRRLFLIMESHPVSATQRREGLFLVKELQSIYGLDRIGLIVRESKEIASRELLCHDK